MNFSTKQKSMKSIFTTFSFEKSLDELDKILDDDRTDVEELNSLPDETEERYEKTLYAFCSVIYVDIRMKSDWTDANKRTMYAKIYRSLVTQLISLFESCKLCYDINNNEKAIWAIFDTKYKRSIDEVISLVAQVNSLLKTLNFKISKREWPTISWGIGVAYDRALLIGVKDTATSYSHLFWGPVLKKAARLASYGNQTYFDNPIMISDIFYSNLNEEYKKLFTDNKEHDCYHGNIVNIEMDEWYKKNNV